MRAQREGPESPSVCSCLRSAFVLGSGDTALSPGMGLIRFAKQGQPTPRRKEAHRTRKKQPECKAKTDLQASLTPSGIKRFLSDLEQDRRETKERRKCMENIQKFEPNEHNGKKKILGRSMHFADGSEKMFSAHFNGTRILEKDHHKFDYATSEKFRVRTN